jgi:hypothetical protein
MYNLHVLAPVFSENSVDQVAEEKGISRTQRVGTAIKPFIFAPRRQGPESLLSELEQARTKKEKTWRESVQLRRNEEQLTPRRRSG